MTAPQLTAYVEGQTSVTADRLNTFCQTCTSVAQIRGIIGVSGMEILLRGLVTDNDGGAGAFYWDASATGPDNGTNVIVPTGAATGAWVRLQTYGVNNTFQFSTTLALLAAFANTIVLPDGSMATTGGRNTIDDGGGSQFVYMASDTTSADNGGTIRVDGAGRRWYAVLNGSSCNVELFGVFGGDVSFNAGHAAANKTAIDNMLANGPYTLLFQTPGFYSTTGHILDGNHPHKIVGLGQSATNAVVGSGIPYFYAADVVASDPIAGKNFVFQNGIQGAAGHIQFSYLSVLSSNNTTTGAVMCGTALSVSTNWDMAADNCFFRGYVGWAWEWANGNLMERNLYVGSVYAQSRVIPNIAASQGSNIQKITEISPTMTCLANSSGTLYFENDPGVKETLTSNVFVGAACEFALNGFVIDGFSTWINPHIEQITGTLLAGDTNSISQTYWLNPDFGGGNSGAQLKAALGTASTMLWNSNYYGPKTAVAQFVGGVDAGIFTVATLPVAPPVGTRSFVSDSTVAGATNFGAAVTGGSNNSVPVYFDAGSTWRIG